MRALYQGGKAIRRHRGEATVEGIGEALGLSRGGFSTELHLRAEGGGRPITAVLTAGEGHEQFASDDLVEMLSWTRAWCHAQGEAVRACVPVE